MLRARRPALYACVAFVALLARWATKSLASSWALPLLGACALALAALAREMFGASATAPLRARSPLPPPTPDFVLPRALEPREECVSRRRVGARAPLLARAYISATPAPPGTGRSSAGRSPCRRPRPRAAP